MRRLVVATVLVLLLAGCSGGDERPDSSGASSGEVATTVAGRAAYDSAGGGGSTGSATSDVADEAVQPAEAKVVRTASLQVEVKGGRFEDAVQEANRLAASLGGFVQSSSTSSFEDGRGSADITLRVPVARFDDALERLADLGKLESQSIEGDDVTGQLVDLGARLKTLRAEEEALNAILAEARNVGDLLAVRSQITGLRQQIEQLSAQQASLEDRSAFATISMALHEPKAAPKPSEGPDSWTLGKAWDTAVDAAEAVVGGLIVAVGVALPLAVLALPLWWVRRRRIRRHGAKVA